MHSICFYQNDQIQAVSLSSFLFKKMTINASSLRKKDHFFHPRFLVSRLVAIEFSSPQWSMIRTTPSIRNVRWARPHEGSSMEGPSIEMVGKSTEDGASKNK